jgi:hypothetical protein
MVSGIPIPPMVAVRHSQPFASIPSQLPKPGLHEVSRHPPIVQVPVPFANVHTLPQRPQFIASVAVSTSQPSLRSLLQSLKPALQVMMHMLLAHEAIAFGYGPQTFPHIPQ